MQLQFMILVIWWLTKVISKKILGGSLVKAVQSVFIHQLMHLFRIPHFIETMLDIKDQLYIQIIIKMCQYLQIIFNKMDQFFQQLKQQFHHIILYYKQVIVLQSIMITLENVRMNFIIYNFVLKVWKTFHYPKVKALFIYQLQQVIQQVHHKRLFKTIIFTITKQVQ